MKTNKDPKGLITQDSISYLSTMVMSPFSNLCYPKIRVMSTILCLYFILGLNPSKVFILTNLLNNDTILTNGFQSIGNIYNPSLSSFVSKSLIFSLFNYGYKYLDAYIFFKKREISQFVF